jgi:pectate lyase
MSVELCAMWMVAGLVLGCAVSMSGGVAPERGVPAFPGAEGYGKWAKGGRGGKALFVTNLDDSGPGSLRAACEAEGPRTVIFRVGGTIELAAPIRIAHPFITIAGQTAPGDGICLKLKQHETAGTLMEITAHDVVIRYLRTRGGFPKASLNPYGGQSYLVHGGTRLIWDHCSMSWSPGRTGVTISPRATMAATDVTVQRCLASEALLGGDYPEGARGAFLWSSRKGDGTPDSPAGVIDRISFYRNLMAHHQKRHPEAKTCQQGPIRYIAHYQLVNNVAYHYNIDGMLLIGNEHDSSTYHIPDGEACHYNVIANYFKREEFRGKDHTEVAITPGTRVYVGDHRYGNIGPHRMSESQDPWESVSFINWGPLEEAYPCPRAPYQLAAPFDSEHVPPVIPAEQAYEDVLNDVGANTSLNGDGTWRDALDPVDLRIIANVRHNTGEFIRSPADVGGWPEYRHGVPYPDEDGDGMSDEWELRHFGTLDRDGTGDFNGDGYTDLEDFLNGTDPRSQPSE